MPKPSETYRTTIVTRADGQWRRFQDRNEAVKWAGDRHAIVVDIDTPNGCEPPIADRYGNVEHYGEIVCEQVFAHGFLVT